MTSHHATTSDSTATIARFRAAVTQWRLWVCEVLLWLAEGFNGTAVGRQWRAALHADRLALMRGLRSLIVLMALQRVGVAPPDWNATAYRRRAARGCVLTHQRGSELRHLTRCVRFRGRGLRGAFERLHAVIDTLDACADKVARQLARSFRQRGPRAVRCAADAVCALAGVAPSRADTS